MKKWVDNFNDLTDIQKQRAIEQYQDIRSEEEQVPCSEERAREQIETCTFEIDTEDEFYIFVNV